MTLAAILALTKPLHCKVRILLRKQCLCLEEIFMTIITVKLKFFYMECVAEHNSLYRLGVYNIPAMVVIFCRGRVPEGTGWQSLGLEPWALDGGLVRQECRTYHDVGPSTFDFGPRTLD